tara:strand:+ start:19500 stop:20225 length:726 start_codon:yes stop_codon:yes gene_type:complete
MSKNSRLKREAKKYTDCDMKPSNVAQFERKNKQLEAITPLQQDYISVLRHDEMVVGAGRAGTGKTYISSRVAAEFFRDHKFTERLILTRPNVEVGKGMGYLPGEISEKYAPYLEPFEKGLKDELGANKYNNDLYKNIIPTPLCYMRGKTFDNAIMLLDEAQNTTIEEMKMFLTRVGTNSKIFITGDESDQNDLRVKENGLQWLIREARRQHTTIEIIQFGIKDCVRSPLCKDMLQLIERAE